MPLSERLRAAARAALFYARWYPKQWLPVSGIRAQIPGPEAAALAGHLRYAARTSRRLARSLFHAMVRRGPKLERDQLLLGRFVDIGAELFAITATCLRAGQLMQSESPGCNKAEWFQLADYFCSASRLRIEEKFRGIRRNADRAGYRLAQQVLAGNRSVSRNGHSSHD